MLTLGKPANNRWSLDINVKSSGVRQSKILSLAGLGRFGRQRVNGDIVFQ